MINFLPSGKVGSTIPSSYLDTLNTVLSPVITTLQKSASINNVTNFEFWELMNWIFVSQYWLLLLDFGQIAPSTWNYDPQTVGGALDYGPVKHTAENNIFVNETLFDQYNSYLRNTILPLFGGYNLADFLPLNSTNRMNESTTSLKMLYTCSDKQLKDSAGLIISVIVADWGMITSVAALGVFVLAWWRLRGEKDVNQCKGCIERRASTIDLPPAANGAKPGVTVTQQEAVGNGRVETLNV